MATKEDIIEIIFNSIEEINQQSGTNLSKDVETRLFGFTSDLDSFGLVNLIATIEENINLKYNVAISIADEKAMSLKNSPFRNVNTLADYIHDLLSDKK